MEDNLTWFDKNIVPRTKAYKNFAKEMESMSPEIFFQDGERMFTDKEKKFMSIHQSKAREVIIGSNFTLKSIFHSNPDLVIRDTFNNPTELVRFTEKQQLANKQLILQNNRESTEITISNESIKQKFLSDLWAQELEKKTDLSSGLTYTQIDEKQAHHYRNYEVEAAKLSLEGIHQIEMTDVEENADFFSDKGFEENLTPASDLPEGWTWNDYDDGSGSLKSPSGHRYYSYDMLTQEYTLPYGRREWTGMRDFYDAPKSLNEFKNYVEKDLKAKVVQNNLYPKLSEEEKNDILNYRIFMKENEFILENLQITANQKKAYSEKMEFGTTDGDYSLTKAQMDTIPNVIDGHMLSKNDKYELAFGLLEKQLYGEFYELLDSGEIIKNYLEVRIWK